LEVQANKSWPSSERRGRHTPAAEQRSAEFAQSESIVQAHGTLAQKPFLQLSGSGQSRFDVQAPDVLTQVSFRAHPSPASALHWY
jgi:hypothetical protein